MFDNSCKYNTAWLNHMLQYVSVVIISTNHSIHSCQLIRNRILVNVLSPVYLVTLSMIIII